MTRSCTGAGAGTASLAQMANDRCQGREEQGNDTDHGCSNIGVIAILSQNDHTDEARDNHAVNTIYHNRPNLMHYHGSGISDDYGFCIIVYCLLCSDYFRILFPDYTFCQEPDDDDPKQLTDQKYDKGVKYKDSCYLDGITDQIGKCSNTRYDIVILMCLY